MFKNLFFTLLGLAAAFGAGFLLTPAGVWNIMAGTVLIVIAYECWRV